MFVPATKARQVTINTCEVVSWHVDMSDWNQWMQSSPVWEHMTICSLMQVLSRLNLTNGELGSFDILYIMSHLYFSSCKILREATPSSLVILDGSWSVLPGGFCYWSTQQSWDAGLQPMWELLSFSSSASSLSLSGWNGHCWSCTTSTRNSHSSTNVLCYSLWFSHGRFCVPSKC